MAALTFAKSPCASFGHLAMYSSTSLLLPFVAVAFSPRRSVLCIVMMCWADVTFRAVILPYAAHQSGAITKALDLDRHFCDDTIDKAVGRRRMREIPSV
jgi:hypothetical protein